MVNARRIVIFTGATLLATAAYAAISHNSSRSNFSRVMPVGGTSTEVNLSYEFKWSIDAGKTRLSPEDRQVLLESVFDQIREDVLR